MDGLSLLRTTSWTLTQVGLEVSKVEVTFRTCRRSTSCRNLTNLEESNRTQSVSSSSIQPSKQPLVKHHGLGEPVIPGAMLRGFRIFGHDSAPGTQRHQAERVRHSLVPHPLPFAGSTVLSLTRGPAGESNHHRQSVRRAAIPRGQLQCIGDVQGDVVERKCC